MQNRVLHFIQKPSFEIGKTYTSIRKGQKWADLTFGQTIDLCYCPDIDVEHTIIGAGFVLEIWIGQYKDILARHIEKSPIQENVTYSSLFKHLERVYGSMFASDIVTVITYKKVS